MLKRRLTRYGLVVGVYLTGWLTVLNCGHSPIATPSNISVGVDPQTTLIPSTDDDPDVVESGGVSDGTLFINFNAEVTWDTVYSTEVILAKYRKDPSVKRVFLIITSNGGGTDPAFLLSGKLVNYTKPVVCYVPSHAFSAAFMVLQACDRRILAVEGSLMVHEPHMYMLSPHPLDRYQLADRLKDMEDTSDLMAGFISTRMGMTTEDYKARIKGIDWYMNVVTALENHAIDMADYHDNIPPGTKQPEPNYSLPDPRDPNSGLELYIPYKPNPISPMLGPIDPHLDPH